jgi:hypothetical protein
MIALLSLMMVEHVSQVDGQIAYYGCGLRFAYAS